MREREPSVGRKVQRTRPASTAAVAGVLGVCVLAGCAGHRSTAQSTMTVPADRYDVAFSTAQVVLTDLGFQLDRVDYRFGRITTQPLDAPSVIELWRPTRGDLSVSGPSTWNQQRRVAAVTLEPAQSNETSRTEPSAPPEQADATAPHEGSTGPYALHVVVMQERRERPTIRLSGSTAGRSVFNNLRDVPAEWRQRGITNDYYLPVGRDAGLEARIGKTIARRMEGQP